jgi:hypothetical protein
MTDKVGMEMDGCVRYASAELFSQSVNQLPTNQSIDRSIVQSINQTTNQPTNQSTKQLINKINQSI